MTRAKPLAAFTLLELLVVVAIIVVLVAILIPHLEQAMVHATKAKCGGQFHGWGVALAQYGGSNNRSFPYNRDGADFSWMGPTVRQFWKEYMGVPYDLPGEVTQPVDCSTAGYHVRLRRDWGWPVNLIGNFYLPHRSPGGWNYDPDGDGNSTLPWLTKTKFGEWSTQAPIVMDMNQSENSSNWYNSGAPLANHAEGPTGIPSGGNFLFEGGHVLWYHYDEIEIGAIGGPWHMRYKIPVAER